MTCLNKNCTFVHLRSTKRHRDRREPETDQANRPRHRENNGRSQERPPPSVHYQGNDQRPLPQRTRSTSSASQQNRTASPSRSGYTNSSSEVSFLVRMIQDMKSGFQKDLNHLRESNEHGTSTHPMESPGTPAIPSPASPSNSTRSPHPTSTPHAESTPVESSYSSILFLNSQSISPDARSSSKWKIPFISENRLNKDGSNVPILGVSETWLKSYITDAQIHIPNYIPFRGDRSSRRRGGTLQLHPRRHCCIQHQPLR